MGLSQTPRAAAGVAGRPGAPLGSKLGAWVPAWALVTHPPAPLGSSMLALPVCCIPKCSRAPGTAPGLRMRPALADPQPPGALLRP